MVTLPRQRPAGERFFVSAAYVVPALFTMGALLLVPKLSPTYREVQRWRSAPVCEYYVAVITTAPDCRQRANGTVVNRSVHSASRGSKSYYVDLAVPALTRIPSLRVDYKVYREAAIGSPAVVEMWGGEVAHVAVRGVGSDTDEGPFNDALAVWIPFTLLVIGAAYLAGWARVTQLRESASGVLPDVAGGPVTIRPTPTVASMLGRGSPVFCLFLMLAVLAFLGGVAIVSLLLLLFGYALAALMVRFRQRNSLLLDREGITELRHGRVLRQIPWETVRGMVWYGSGKSRHHVIGFAGGHIEPSLYRGFTARNEGLIWAVRAWAGTHPR
jgi:hypothetical protein